MNTQISPSEITVAQLFEAYYDCRKRKRNTASALAFEIDLESNLMALFEELRAGEWQPQPATVFVVRHPKPREVWAAAFRDRIVHHLVYNAIAPKIERAFIHDSCACIRDRGTLYGANRLQHHLASVTENWTKPAFVLKADIANFFGSIRQDILFAKLSRLVTDPTMLDLCRKLVFQDVRKDAVVKSTAKELALVLPHKSLFQAVPNFQQRWCTRMLKIEPYAEWLTLQVVSGPVRSYVGLRADEEDREGGDYRDISFFGYSVQMEFPMREWGWGLEEVVASLERRGICIPRRTDCAHCYHQTLFEWWTLWNEAPEIYAEGEAWEKATGFTLRSPGRDTWPSALKDLRKEFEASRIPKQRKRATSCRACNL